MRITLDKPIDVLNSILFHNINTSFNKYLSRNVFTTF